MKITVYGHGDRARAVSAALVAAGHGRVLPAGDPELAVVAGYGRIFSEEEISRPKYGTINCHAGKLPEYRGGSPLNWALINGDPHITATLLQMDAGIDTGMIIDSCPIHVGDSDTIDTLHDRINGVFPRLILEYLDNMLQGGGSTLYGQTGTARYWPQRVAADSEITLDMTPAKVYNKVRACREPYPAFLRLGKHRYKMEIIP